MTSDNTTRAYEADWRDFTAWCDPRGLRALPAEPETVALYLTALDQAGRRPSTLRRRLAAIAQRHAAHSLAVPTTHPAVRGALQSIENTQALDAAVMAKAPLLPSELRRLVRLLPGGLSGARDRAILLVGQAGRLRRSDIVALDVADLAIEPSGMTLRSPDAFLARGTDEALCPVTATEDWLATSGIDDGPLFRSIDRFGRVSETRLSDRSVALIVKRAAQAAGLDASRYAASSLRSGAAIGALLARAEER
jgi:site-specific recombinase XerD